MRRVAPRTEVLLDLLRRRRRLLVLTHTNPDPDSLASGMALRYFAQSTVGMPSDFGLSGRIMRAENKEMVKQLGIQLTPIEELDLDAYDCVAVVDSQPGFGHTQIPEGCKVDIVVDHHVAAEDCQHLSNADFLDVRCDVGATSSLVTHYFMEARVVPTSDVATALIYGIKTDTADLSRNVSDVDLRAHEFLFPHVDRKKLASITRPALPIAYYQALKEALNKVRIYGKVVLCSLGKTSNAEMVAEVADLLLRLEGAEAVFCGGLVGNTYHVSVRTLIGHGDAWRLIHDALAGEGTYGGHGSVAGGCIVLPDDEPRTLKRLERRLEKNILRSTGVEGVSLSSLKGSSADEA